MSDEITSSAPINSVPSPAESAAMPPDAPESVEQAQGVLSQASTPAEKKAVEKQLKKLQIKANGKVYDEEFDPNDDEYLTRQFSKAKAFDYNAAEKAQLEKEVRNFVEELRKNPKKVLSDPTIGLDMKKLAASIIEEEIENSKKSPEQIKQEELEEELRSIKAEREKEKEESRTRDFQRLQQQEFERYDTLMTQTLDKSDLPKSPYVVKKMADYMLMGLQEGIDVTPADVLSLVREEIQSDLKEMFQVMPDEVVEKLIGKDKLNSIRKKNLAKAKSSPTTTSTKSIQDTGNSSKPETKPGKAMTFKEFFGT